MLKMPKAALETKHVTAGKYNGTDYEFRHKVQIKDYYGSLVYIINDKGNRDQRTILYIHGGAWFQDPLDSHFEYIDLMADTLDAKLSCLFIQKFRTEIIVQHLNY